MLVSLFGRGGFGLLVSPSLVEVEVVVYSLLCEVELDWCLPWWRLYLLDWWSLVLQSSVDHLYCLSGGCIG